MSQQKVILFIEDESALQKVFKDALTKEGYKVVSALDGQEGIDLAKSQKPNLILLDLILPRKDGFSVLEEIKADKEISSIPVIVLTNLESSSDVERAITMGANSYLVKANYKLDEVISKIKDLFDSIQ